MNIGDRRPKHRTASASIFGCLLKGKREIDGCQYAAMGNQRSCSRNRTSLRQQLIFGLDVTFFAPFESCFLLEASVTNGGFSEGWFPADWGGGSPKSPCSGAQKRLEKTGRKIPCKHFFEPILNSGVGIEQSRSNVKDLLYGFKD